MPEPTKEEFITMFDNLPATQKDIKVNKGNYTGPREKVGKDKYALMFIDNHPEYYENNKLKNTSDFKTVANRLYELINGKTTREMNTLYEKDVKKQYMYMYVMWRCGAIQNRSHISSCDDRRSTLSQASSLILICLYVDVGLALQQY